MNSGERQTVFGRTSSLLFGTVEENSDFLKKHAHTSLLIHEKATFILYEEKRKDSARLAAAT